MSRSRIALIRFFITVLLVLPALLCGEESTLQQAQKAYQAGDYDQAIAILTKVIRVNPQDAKAYNVRGAAYSQKHDYGKAIADFSLVISLEPKMAGPYSNRGTAYEATGEYDKAIADLSAALRLDPNLTEPYYNRGNLYRKKAEYNKAIADYDEVIRLNARYEPAWANRGLTYGLMGKNDKAIADFSKAIQLDPKDAVAYLNRGNAYKACGDNDRAIWDYTDAIWYAPEDAIGYYNRGAAYVQKGDYSKAVGDYEEGMIDFKRAISVDSKHADSYHGIALMLAECPQAEIRDGRKAVEYARKACELSDWKEPTKLNTLAAAYAESGDFDQAIRWEKKCLELPKLDEKAIKNARERLALYEAHKPYHGGSQPAPNM